VRGKGRATTRPQEIATAGQRRGTRQVHDLAAVPAQRDRLVNLRPSPVETLRSTHSLRPRGIHELLFCDCMVPERHRPKSRAPTVSKTGGDLGSPVLRVLFRVVGHRECILKTIRASVGTSKSPSGSGAIERSRCKCAPQTLTSFPLSWSHPGMGASSNCYVELLILEDPRLADRCLPSPNHKVAPMGSEGSVVTRLD